MQTKSNTVKIVLTALMMCLVMVLTMFVRVPIPFTQGYVHLGDVMVFVSVLILGVRYGAIAAGVGAMLADLIGGFAAWAPWTFAIKAIMAVILGCAVMLVSKGKNPNRAKFRTAMITGMVTAGAFMAAGYYAAEGIMYGNWVVAALGIPWNIGQFAVGMVIAVIIAEALYKTPVKTYFTYRLPEKE